MTNKPLKTSRAGASFALGLAATTIIALACALGVSERVELMALDVLFRRFSPAAADDKDAILHVDIDDGSIEQIGRWPWPRAQLAGVIDVLGECGARTIVLDISLPTPQKVRYESAADEVYGAVNAQLASDAPPTPVFDDALLTDAIRRAPKLALPMHIDFAAGADAHTDAPPEPAADGAISRELRLRAMNAMSRFAVEPTASADHPLAAGPMTPPLAPFAESADLSGFVTFTPDVDGVVRRIGILGGSDGRIYMQFAAALAADELADRHGEIVSVRADERSVTFTFADGTRRVLPTDSQGQMFIGWRGQGPGYAEHIPISKVAAVWQHRQSIDRNNRLARITVAKMAQLLGQEELKRLFAQADELYGRRTAVQRRRYIAMVHGELPAPDNLAELLAAEAWLERQIDEHTTELRENLDFYLPEHPATPAAQADAERVVELADLLDRIDAANARKAEYIDRQLDSVRRDVNGRICLIGSTATSAADFVPTPLGPRIPGAVVNANIYSTILTGRFIRPGGPVATLLIVLLAGAAVSAVAAWRPMLHAALAAAVLSAGYLALAAATFRWWGLWLTVVGPLAAVVAGYLTVAVFRQLTEERAKQHIRKMFAHALSPTLVDRLLADPSLAQLGGQRRHITCMFSDLAGFTALSERLGPQRTVGLLNRYFDRVTEVVQQRGGGYLNKFLGDGIFCFFGAPIDQPDHPARAIQAAVGCRREVARLNTDLADESSPLGPLAVRVGIASGEAMVGNCGSTERMDYTAIGDCVNLASRLESANKLLGTGILVADDTWRLAGLTDLSARPIGRAMVTGVAEPIRLWQVLPAGEVSQDMERWRDDFARAVELFESSRFAEAAKLFDRVRRAAGDDQPTRIYLTLCSYGLARSPGEPWRPPGDTTDGVIAIAPPPAATGGE